MAHETINSKKAGQRKSKAGRFFQTHFKNRTILINMRWSKRGEAVLKWTSASNNTGGQRLTTESKRTKLNLRPIWIGDGEKGGIPETMLEGAMEGIISKKELRELQD